MSVTYVYKPHKYNKAIELRPNFSSAGYCQRGIVKHHLALCEDNDATRTSMLESAIADYNQAISLGQADAEIHENRGKAYKELGREQEAKEDFEMAAKLKSQG